MTRRMVIQPDGIYISRPGYDALDSSVVRLVEPQYRMIEQHHQAEASSVFVDGHSGGSGGPAWSLHRATVSFSALPYIPVHHYAMTLNYTGFDADTIRYPNYVFSEAISGAVVPQGKAQIGTDYFWCEASVATYTTLAGLLRVRVTIMKADSGL